MSIACGADPFFVGSDVLDIGSRKSELRGRRNRMAPLDHSFGIPEFSVSAVDVCQLPIEVAVVWTSFSSPSDSC